jgi:TetR/AcrR family transcriptional repressor of nem operon
MAIDKSKTIGHIQSMPRHSVKEQIVTAAIETLHRQGFNGTSVQDITEAAAVPKGSFYNHFSSKEELAVEALDRYWNGVLHNLGELSNHDHPPLERLKRYFDRLSNVALNNKYERGCMIGNMSTEMPAHSDAIRERLAAILAAWGRALESCVKEAQEGGTIRRDIPAKALAAFLLNSWEGAIQRSKVDRDASAFKAYKQVMFTSLMP